MADEIYDYAIVGAGLTGLNLGLELRTKNSAARVINLEKSKGCGGRMATRRINEIKFDHGAQFIKYSAASKKLIEIWQAENLAKAFPSMTIEGVCGQSGITQLAKKIANSLEITYDCKVSRLERSDRVWNVVTDRGPVVRAARVVLTSPLPQSIEILRSSELSFDPVLARLQYSKALVVMIEASSELGPEFNYQENVNSDVFSICAQHAKGNSSVPAWTVVMSQAWSTMHFDLTDDQILQKAKTLISKIFETLQIRDAHLKKWRYCQPVTTWKNPFESPQVGLYLAGDAFGGPSLLGALKSSYRLAYHLEKESELVAE